MKVRQLQRSMKGQDHVRILQGINKALRGGISFGYKTQTGIVTDNLDGCWEVMTTAAANTEVAIPHTLRRIPIGFDVKRQNAACSVYDSGTAWTTSHIYIKCSTATVTLTLFIH